MTRWSRRSFVKLTAHEYGLGGEVAEFEAWFATLLGVNESWNRTTGAALAEAFHRAAD